MTRPDLAHFRSQALTVLDPHPHPFARKAVVD